MWGEVKEVTPLQEDGDFTFTRHEAVRIMALRRDGRKLNHEEKLALWQSCNWRKQGTATLMYRDKIIRIVETVKKIRKPNDIVLAVMTEAYTEEDLGEGNSRIVLKLKKHLAPIKVAVIPLKKNNEQIMNKCHELKKELMKLGIGRVALENTGNIGKAYRRHDEIGTPLCLTVDFETIEQQPESVTIRDRDSMQQIRVNTADLKDYLRNYFAE